MVPGIADMAAGIGDTFPVDYNEANYEVFDPLNWMLDGVVDFPYGLNTITGLDQSGVSVPGLHGEV